MRVCSKCGHSDNLLWENDRFKRDLQVMQLEDFKREYPLLAERIEKEPYLRDGQFLYHLSKGRYVLRKEPADWNQPFWENFEAHRQVKTKRPDMAHFHNRLRQEKKVQTKLLELKQVEEKHVGI